MTEERCKIEIAYWRQRAAKRFDKALLNKGEFLVMRKKYEEAQQKCGELQQEVDLLTIPINNRFEILDL